MLDYNNYKSLNMNPKNNDISLSKIIFTEDAQLKQNNGEKVIKNDLSLTIQVQDNKNENLNENIKNKITKYFGILLLCGLE